MKMDNKRIRFIKYLAIGALAGIVLAQHNERNMVFSLVTIAVIVVLDVMERNCANK
jgi:uncharacterized membrane protein YebE (DUF533 family)